MLNYKLTIKDLVAVLLVFFYLFRPQILFPVFSSSLLVAFLGFCLIVSNKANFKDCFMKLGSPSLLLYLALLLWALGIDLLVGGFQEQGFRAISVGIIRLGAINIVGAYFIVNYLCDGSYYKFRRILLAAILFQLLLGLLMFISVDFKVFIYKYLSGYNGSEKLFKPHFIESRIFGWSEELFFLAPVAMVFSVVFFYEKFSFTYIVFSIMILLISFMNARLSIVALGFAFLLRAGVIKGAILMFFSIGLSLLLLLNYSDSPIVTWFMSDFSDGRSQTLDILLENHIVWTLDNWFSVLVGNGVYTFGNSDEISDIGWLIIFNFGGGVFALLWVLFLFSVIKKAFNSYFIIFTILLFMFVLNIKGLAFSSNAMLGILLCLCFLGSTAKEE